MKQVLTISSFVLLASGAQGQSSSYNYASHINPFWGTVGSIPNYTFGGGAVFVGAARPHGIVKLAMDTYVKNTSIAALQGGYTPNGLITGFSLMHESGTGGCSKYGVIAQMPLTNIDGGNGVNLLDNRTYWQERIEGSDTAGVGWFSTELTNGVRVKLAASRQTGVYEYTYPSKQEQGKGKNVLVDVSHYLPNVVGGYCTQTYRGGEIKISSDKKTYTGHGIYAGGFNEGAQYTVYFCGEFETAPDQVDIFSGRNQFPGFNSMNPEPLPWPTFASENITSPQGARVGAVFSWTGNELTIKSKVGISFISTDRACAAKDTEVRTWDLQDTINEAEEEWNREIFSTIQIATSREGVNNDHVAMLYSSLYFMHLIPSNRTGENPLWGSDEPYWDDFYCLWDTYRTSTPLDHLILPSTYTSQIRSLINIYRHQGYMPDGRSGNDNGLVQGGSNSDNVLADAYVKGLTGIDWQDGYAAMQKNAEVSTNGSNKEGRGAGKEWAELGYVPLERPRSISRTVEYSLNDFALYLVAKGLDKSPDATRYLNRSAGWQNLWSASTLSLNTAPKFDGFLTPRWANGSFNSTGYNPAQCGSCSWGAVSYEGTPFEYSFGALHDVQSMIEKMGGRDKFEGRLDFIFLPNTSQADLGANGAGIRTIMNIGNEPDFATPYLYNYVNKSWKSVNQSRTLAGKYFTNTPNGMPGNSDAGALNSWLIWQMLGLYPIVPSPVYLLHSPWFPDLNMTVNHDRKLRIQAHGLNETEGSIFVQSVEVNGKPWTKNWIEHKDIMVDGGRIEFYMGSQPKIWETSDSPPSLGHLTL